MKDKRNLIILSLLLLMIGLSYGFISYSTKVIQMNQSSEVKKWDVSITNVEVITNGTAREGETKYSEGTLVINPVLIDPNDSIVYRVTIANNGLLDAKLARSLYKEEKPNSVLTYTYENTKEVLKSKESIEITIIAQVDRDKYVAGEEITNKLTALFEYIQN